MLTSDFREKRREKNLRNWSKSTFISHDPRELQSLSHFSRVAFVNDCIILHPYTSTLLISEWLRGNCRDQTVKRVLITSCCNCTLSKSTDIFASGFFGKKNYQFEGWLRPQLGCQAGGFGVVRVTSDSSRLLRPGPPRITGGLTVRFF